MSDAPTTLGELFGIEEQQGLTNRSDTVARARDNLRVELEGLTDIEWAPIEDEIVSSLGELLDIGIADIFARAWAKLKELQEYRDEARHPADETSLVPLHRHSMKSTHKPKIRLYSGDTEIATIEFVVQGKFDIEAANLKIRGGRIIEILSGEYSMSGEVLLAGETLIDQASRAYSLPGRISLGRGIEIPAI